MVMDASIMRSDHGRKARATVALLRVDSKYQEALQDLLTYTYLEYRNGSMF